MGITCGGGGVGTGGGGGGGGGLQELSRKTTAARAENRADDFMVLSPNHVALR
jgi:hypothetical protein